MRYDLAALAKAARPGSRKKVVEFRPIVPTQALASDLYLRSYKPLIVALTEALPDITAAYERGLSQLIRDAASDDAQSVLDTLGSFLERLVISLEPTLRDWAVNVERWHRGKWRGAALTATGVDLGTMLVASGEPASVADAIRWNVSLIRDVSAQAQARIGNLVFSAFQARRPVADLARDLRGAVDMSRTRALRIASDQTSKLSAALDRERQADAGIEKFKWRHSRKLHPRKIHVQHDGHVYAWTEPPKLEGRADFPGDLPYCGCRAQAVLELD